MVVTSDTVDDLSDLVPELELRLHHHLLRREVSHPSEWVSWDKAHHARCVVESLATPIVQGLEGRRVCRVHIVRQVTLVDPVTEQGVVVQIQEIDRVLR